MSEWNVEVITVEKIGHHPNADRLDIVHVRGLYQCVVARDTLAPGVRALYVPVDSMVPISHPAFAFLAPHAKDGYARIRAIRLRGIFSMGLLIPISEFNNPFVDLPGAHVADLLGIKKYEPPVEWWQTNADAVKEPPVGAPVYDIEGVRRYPTILRPGEEVYVTEKIHGTNARFLFHDGEFFVGSHKRWLKETDNLWWRIAKKYEMQTMCKAYPDVIFFGEIFGPGIQDMTYGLKEPEIRFFDLFDTRSRSYFGFLDWFDTFCDLALPVVPLLEVAPYSDSLLAMAEGQSVIRGANHIREGIVIKPTIERLDVEIGRVILKLPSESYLLRKEK